MAMGDSLCFFRIDSKSFELRIDWTKDGGEFQIVEKGKGFRRWIKARRGVVAWILKALEACCNWRGKKSFKEDAIDRGRRYKMEMHQNEAGRFLMLSVLSEDDRRYFIFIPEGFDLLGWEFMRCKLKGLAKIGEVSKSGTEASRPLGGGHGGHALSLVRPDLSYVNATKRLATGERNRSEEVWIEVGNEAYTSKLKDLSRFLVGRWDAEDEKGPDLRVVEIWANTQWSFCGKVRVAALRDALFLFEFSNKGDAQRVLQEGSRLLKGVRLSLDW